MHTITPYFKIRFFLILSFHLRPGLPRGIIPSCYSTRQKKLWLQITTSYYGADIVFGLNDIKYISILFRVIPLCFPTTQIYLFRYSIVYGTKAKRDTCRPAMETNGKTKGILYHCSGLHWRALGRHCGAHSIPELQKRQTKMLDLQSCEDT